MIKVIGFWAGVIGLVLLYLLFMSFGFVKCYVAEHDLKRDTAYSWVTGNCMVETSTGERIYLHMLRGVE